MMALNLDWRVPWHVARHGVDSSLLDLI